MLLIFAIAYPILFDPRATTAGRLILNFVGSLIGIVGLVFIAVFIDPRAGGLWFEFPGDVLWWRPAVRFLAYAYVAYSLTGLVALLWMRKFRPQRLHTAPEETTIPVVVRHRKK